MALSKSEENRIT